MKSTLILVLSLLAIANAQLDFTLSCSKTKCVKPMEVCGSINNTLFVTEQFDCRGDAACSRDSDQLTGICIEPARLGEYCDRRADCESGLECNDNYCAASAPRTEYLRPGDSCDNHWQCAYDDPLGWEERDRCNGGHCRSVKNGQYCNGNSYEGTYQCHFQKSFCGNKNLCEKNIKKGGACFFDDRTQYGCGRKNRCMPNGGFGNAGNCQPKYSLKEGSYCRDMSDCDEGLFCAEPRDDLDYSYGICTKPKKTLTLNKICPDILDITGNGGCDTDNQEICRCEDDSETKTCVANVYAKGYGDADWDQDECVRKNCPNGEYSCLRRKCSKQICKSYNVGKKNGGIQFSCNGDSFCNSAFSLVASPLVVVLAILAVFMF